MKTCFAGPIEYLMVRFPGVGLNEAIVAEMRELARRGVVRVVDVLLVCKHGDGVVESIELDDLIQELGPCFADVDGQLEGGLLDEEDGHDLGTTLEPDSTIAVIAIENLWMVPFVDAVRSAGGEYLY